VGPARARALADAGLVTVLDLLRHVPYRWEDRREVVPVAAATAGRAATFRGRLAEVRRIRTRRRGFSLVRAVIKDGTGTLPVVWFNQPYLFQQLRDAEEYLLHGAVRDQEPGLELLNPTCEAVDRALHSARIVPVYSSIGTGKGSLGAAALRRLLDAVLEDFDPASVPEPLPEDLLLRRGLPRLGEALLALHRPERAPEAAGLTDTPEITALNERRSPAHRRLAYEELLRMQVAVALLRARETAAPRTLIYRVDDRLRGVVRGLLPFRLTAAQKRVLGEIVADLRGPHPMLRLLQGDVGSGKTLVAALALVVALESGFQGAFMAPTELLAEQHFATLERLLGHRYRVGLFVGGKGGKSDPGLRGRLAAGEVRLAVGTHALIQEGVEFRRLGLAVVDEQHRFGVRQRALLRGKGDQSEQPDLLVMTATPIPRTLALTAWGDLEVSTLDELPPGRTPVATAVVPTGQRRAVYKRVREELESGGRVYVVVPLIEESARTAAASLAEAEERVRAELDGWPCAVLHGRMPAAERDRVMTGFASGDVKVLLATTVIEVGVDVPEATCMVIESAERFGLAQLHQLRGRVGRGARPSRCFAVHGRLSDEGKRRLEVFARTNDGFEIAEEDLKIRGPGDVLGTRQAGLPGFRSARLPEDWELLEQARDDAREVLGRLGEEELAPLREAASGEKETEKETEKAGWAQ
jgi:ATP-dependent DNA helicase RecG